MADKIEIDRKRLIELLAAELELNALNCGGVDNWDWYGDSCCDAIRELARFYHLDEDEVTFKDIAEHIVDREPKYV